MNSVERINHYAHDLLPEGSSESLRGYLLPPADWPPKGAIKFDRVCMAYRPGLPDVLHDVTFSIRGGEKIGVVGRTGNKEHRSKEYKLCAKAYVIFLALEGAGKSSIVTALFRLVDHRRGVITIDGVDIASVSLEELRKHLTIIPQGASVCPSLFRVD